MNDNFAKEIMEKIGIDSSVIQENFSVINGFCVRNKIQFDTNSIAKNLGKAFDTIPEMTYGDMADLDYLISEAKIFAVCSLTLPNGKTIHEESLSTLHLPEFQIRSGRDIVSLYNISDSRQYKPSLEAIANEWFDLDTIDTAIKESDKILSAFDMDNGVLYTKDMAFSYNLLEKMSDDFFYTNAKEYDDYVTGFYKTLHDNYKEFGIADHDFNSETDGKALFKQMFTMTVAKSIYDFTAKCIEVGLKKTHNIEATISFDPRIWHLRNPKDSLYDASNFSINGIDFSPDKPLTDYFIKDKEAYSIVKKELSCKTARPTDVPSKE